MSKGKILLIESDRNIREGLRVLLEGEDYTVFWADNGESSLKLLNKETDLVILEASLPGMSGISTCREIRKVSNVPILFLDGKNAEAEELIDLMAGGDDYLAEPFSYPELLMRVKALLRRYRVYLGKSEQKMAPDSDKYLTMSEIRINKTANEAYVDGEKTDLSDLEYHILLLMMEHPGKIFSAEELYETVWKGTYTYSCSGVVMVHIRKLRLKIEDDPQNPKKIRTVWGKGYRFADQGDVSCGALF